MDGKGSINFGWGNDVSIHLGQFQRLAMALADDSPALIAWGLVLAHIEGDTGRVLLDEYEVARAAEVSPDQARLALKRLAAAGAVYSLPSEQDGIPATSIFINPHVAFKGSGVAHEQALQRVAAPGVSRH